MPSRPTRSARQPSAELLVETSRATQSACQRRESLSRPASSPRDATRLRHRASSRLELARPPRLFGLLADILEPVLTMMWQVLHDVLLVILARKREPLLRRLPLHALQGRAAEAARLAVPGGIAPRAAIRPAPCRPALRTPIEP